MKLNKDAAFRREFQRLYDAAQCAVNLLDTYPPQASIVDEMAELNSLVRDIAYKYKLDGLTRPLTTREVDELQRRRLNTSQKER